MTYSGRYSLVDGIENQSPQTVTQVTNFVKSCLQQNFHSISVIGEVTECWLPKSGHCYFSLVDEHARLNCVIFKNTLLHLPHKPQEGQQFVVTGGLSVYAPRGTYQLIVNNVEPVGIGDYLQQLEETKQKLAAEGLFDKKRELPRYPQRVALITSETGAAFQDIKQILQRRYPLLQLYLFHSLVQGEEAARQLKQAVEFVSSSAQNLLLDLVVISRGGGSAADLVPFNDEQLARSIATCPIPVVSAVGHEIDYSISDLVADVRAPTPSAAAELIVPEKGTVKEKIDGYGERMLKIVHKKLEHRHLQLQLFSQKLQTYHYIKQNFSHRLQLVTDQLLAAQQHVLVTKQQLCDETGLQIRKQDPQSKLMLKRSMINNYHERILIAYRQKISILRQILVGNHERLHALSPKAVLERGYSIIMNDEGNVVRSYNQVQAGDMLQAVLHQGQLGCRVEWTNTKKQ